MLIEGVIASAPDADRRVTVTIPTFHPDQTFGPCPYMPRGGALPTVGAKCLVALDETGTQEPWVPAWDGPDGGGSGGSYIPTSEKAAASGVASLDANTRVPNGQLATGTADATKFLRGDRAWAVPPGGSDGAWTGLTYSNGWTDYGAGWQLGEYRILANGDVELRGLIKKMSGGSPANWALGETIATLPVGARPSAQQLFGTPCETSAASFAYGLGRVDINTSGVVSIVKNANVGDPVGYVSLNNIRL